MACSDFLGRRGEGPGSIPCNRISSRLPAGRNSVGQRRERGCLDHQIADWLKKLRLGQYAERFVDNGIDLSILPDLTDQNWEKLGVLLGHRRKMLRAIAERTTIRHLVIGDEADQSFGVRSEVGGRCEGYDIQRNLKYAPGQAAVVRT